MIKKITTGISVMTLGLTAPMLSYPSDQGTTLIEPNLEINVEYESISTTIIMIGGKEFDLEQGDLKLQTYKISFDSECYEYRPGITVPNVSNKSITTASDVFTITKHNADSVLSLSKTGLKNTDNEYYDELSTGYCDLNNYPNVLGPDFALAHNQSKYLVKYSQTGSPTSKSASLSSSSFDSNGIIKNGINNSENNTIDKKVTLNSLKLAEEVILGEPIKIEVHLENNHGYNIPSIRVDNKNYIINNNIIEIDPINEIGLTEFDLNSIMINGDKFDLDLNFSIDLEQTGSVEIENDAKVNYVSVDKNIVEPLQKYNIEIDIDISHSFYPTEVKIDNEYYDNIFYKHTLNGYELSIEFEMPNLTGNKIHHIQNIKFENLDSGFNDYSFFDIDKQVQVLSTIDIGDHVQLTKVSIDKEVYKSGDDIVLTLDLVNIENNIVKAVTINNVKYAIETQENYSSISFKVNNETFSSSNSLNVQKVHFEIEKDTKMYLTEMLIDFNKELNIVSPIDASSVKLKSINNSNIFKYDDDIIVDIHFTNPNNLEIENIVVNNYKYSINKISSEHIQLIFDMSNKNGDINLEIDSIVVSDIYKNKKFESIVDIYKKIQFEIESYDFSKDIIFGIPTITNNYENIDSILNIGIMENNLEQTIGQIYLNGTARKYEITDNSISINLGLLDRGKFEITDLNIEVINFENNIALKELNIYEEFEILNVNEYILDNTSGITNLYFYFNLVILGFIWTLLSVTIIQILLVIIGSIILSYVSYKLIRNNVSNIKTQKKPKLRYI